MMVDKEHRELAKLKPKRLSLTVLIGGSIRMMQSVKDRHCLTSIDHKFRSSRLMCRLNMVVIKRTWVGTLSGLK